MRRKLMTLVPMAITALALSIAALPTAAHAQEHIDVYRDAMRDFAPEISGWIDLTDEAALRIAAKPELGCEQDISDLARRGTGIASDLEGTGQLAPGALADAHGELTASIGRIAHAAGDACGLGGDLARTIDADVDAARSALRKIARFANAPGTPPVELPVPPVTVN